MGGEPLNYDNFMLLEMLISSAKRRYKDLKVYLWTGYTFEEVVDSIGFSYFLNHNVDILIDGPYIEELRNTALKWRGSSNQRILKKIKDNAWIEEK